MLCNNKFKILVLCYVFLCGHLLFPSIISGSLIKTNNGFTPVESITIGSNIIGYDGISLINVTVTHISKTTTETIIIITTDEGCIYAAPTQLFYNPACKTWIAAQSITTNTTLFNVHANHCSCLNVETISVPPTDVYHISTTNPHNFFVTEQVLLTHNTFPVIIISLAWLLGEGIKFAGLSIGAAALGSYVGIELYNKHKQSNTAFGISPQISTCGGYNPDPNDDDDENNTKARVCNTISKQEFFKKIKNDYEHYRNGTYRRKKGAKGIEKAEYLEWDHLHGDVEAYTKNRQHLGSIDPKTLKIYKGPVQRTISF